MEDARETPASNPYYELIGRFRESKSTEDLKKKVSTLRADDLTGLFAFAEQNIKDAEKNCGKK